MDFKKQYSEEELKELRAWFEARTDTLPASMRLDTGMFIPDLPQTVSKYLDIMTRHKTLATFAPQMYHLYRIRQKLEDEQPNQ